MTPTERINELLELKPNWDSYGSQAISPLATEAALRFLDSVIIVPTSKGGVRLEWHRDGWDIEIEFHPDGMVTADLEEYP